MKPARFVGNSLEIIRAFPDAVRREAGYQIERVQDGDDPQDWKPLRIVGPGVREIRIRGTKGAFRVIYVANLEEAVYILHAFQKKTKTTAKRDLDLAAKRFMQIARK